MDKTTLVDSYINEGKELIKKLDLAQFPVYSALWFFDESSNSWKLLIATPMLTKDGPHKTYLEISKHLSNSKEITLRDIVVLDTSNQLINLLISMLRTERTAISGIRFTGNTINNIYINDAYIYRLS